MYHLDDPINAIPKIGPKQTYNFERIGISTIKDLLYHFPNYYRDTGNIVTIDQLDRESRKTIKVTLKELKNIRIRGGKTIQKGLIEDVSGSINVTWFNQPFIIKSLPLNTEIYLSGKLSSKSLKPELVGPDYEVVKINNINLGKIVPIYPLTQGITIKCLRARFDELIRNLNNISDLAESLPDTIRDEYKLINIKTALKQIHTPESQAALILARKRLAFDELLQIYLKLIKEKNERMESKSPKIEINETQINKFIGTLPFQLTTSQQKAITEIFQDYSRTYPANRLIQGDVGSGKTIVALIAALPVIQSGYQAVLLAPTTVLAAQHYATINKLFNNSIRVGLVTTNTIKDIDDNSNFELIVATHSILYHQSLLKKLGLLIIDEQHKFGVEQRRALLGLESQQNPPHLINLTATPIPRSIALTLFGEIEVSVIDKPKERKVTQTYLVPETKRENSFTWLNNKLRNNSQLFWVCPLIESKEEEFDINEASMKAVNKTAKDLKLQFKKAKIAIIHGKLKTKEKDVLIEDFRLGKINILVSTTVIEVGIDIPGADIIVIENAERFGLAQLHQLRGRVGRNNQDSWCLLFTSLENSEQVTNRLTFFSKENNGIKIAEFDLENRGPGEVYGTIQSGIPNLKVANFGNADFLLQVRSAAQKLLNIHDAK